MEYLSISHLFNRGWARCQKQQNIYGDNFISHFKDDISEMFEQGERAKGENMTEKIMEVNLQRIYSDYYALPQVPTIKIYVGQMTNKKSAREIIEFDDHISSSGRRGRKAS